ncbi:sugar ABC transporter permease [Actinoplanes sp. NPDC051861]|uniref:carbohydrate ABC transporter permease n=1 Tax=Actinoplanes sp. NPDC051861 TaxID=3155170 RepID=UPI00343EC3C9
MTTTTQDVRLREPPPHERLRTPARRGSRALTGWSFAAPFVLIFGVFLLLPVAASLVMSFTDMRATDMRTPWAVEFAGLGNYTRLFGDDLLRRAALNTTVFVLVGVPLTMIAALAAANAVNSGLIRFRAAFRVGFYLPVVTSIVAIAVIWRFLLDPEAGLIDNLLGTIGVDGPNWLGDTRTSLASIIVMAAWRNFGTLMVIFLAGLQGIPQHLYEAATLDGAGRWAQFRHVTLPLLRPALLFGAVITGIGYLQLFEEPLVMTQGGPLQSTLSVSYHVYNQFGLGNYGYASAVSYVLFVAVVALSVLQFRLLGNRDD